MSRNSILRNSWGWGDFLHWSRKSGIQEFNTSDTTQALLRAVKGTPFQGQLLYLEHGVLPRRHLVSASITSILICKRYNNEHKLLGKETNQADKVKAAHDSVQRPYNNKKDNNRQCVKSKTLNRWNRYKRGNKKTTATNKRMRRKWEQIDIWLKIGQHSKEKR